MFIFWRQLFFDIGFQPTEEEGTKNSVKSIDNALIVVLCALHHLVHWARKPFLMGRRRRRRRRKRKEEEEEGGGRRRRREIEQEWTRLLMIRIKTPKDQKK